MHESLPLLVQSLPISLLDPCGNAHKTLWKHNIINVILFMKRHHGMAACLLLEIEQELLAVLLCLQLLLARAASLELGYTCHERSSLPALPAASSLISNAKQSDRQCNC